jgi:hypothetical protein
MYYTRNDSDTNCNTPATPGLASGTGPEPAEVSGTQPAHCSASWQGRRGWRGPGHVGRYGPAGVGWPQRTMNFFSFSFDFSNKLEFALVQNTVACAQKIPNKIWICR